MFQERAMTMVEKPPLLIASHWPRRAPNRRASEGQLPHEKEKRSNGSPEKDAAENEGERHVNLCLAQAAAPWQFCRSRLPALLRKSDTKHHRREAPILVGGRRNESEQ